MCAFTHSPCLRLLNFSGAAVKRALLQIQLECGVLEAAKNAAMYLKDGDGEIVNIPGGDLFLHAENVGLDTKHPKFLFYHKIGGNTGKCF